MVEAAERLRRSVERATPALARLSEEESERRPAPGKWSAKEVLGHLIDSATNNHRRFVLAQTTDELVFPGYDQNAWVSAQRYQDAPWDALVELWSGLNLHLARIMDVMPEDVRTRPRAKHNLHEIAWGDMPANEPATLDDFLLDYVGHLEHHLAQIAALDSA